ncbi:MAG: DUF1330 domain-containing protein [Ktedonobacteraceae bacterium]|nr:DUF1330 domain-containing protein [Ktedonobacteraceae bacterium]
MTAYVIFDEKVFDPEGVREYVQKASQIRDSYGGKVFLAGKTVETFEGDWHPDMLVIIEFESIEQARRWYHSEEYTAVKAIRHRTTNSRVLLIEGSQNIQLPPKTM